MPAPTASTRPDPNIFFSTYLAGLAAANWLPGQMESMAQQAWYIHKRLVEWTVTGADERELKEREAKEAAAQARAEEVARIDKAAREAKLAAAMSAHGGE